MSNSTQATKSNIQAADRSGEAPTTEKARDRAHQAVDGAADRATGVERRIREEAADAQEKFHQTKEAATQQVEDSLTRVESFIKSRPMTAAGIAFAAGILASRLMRS